MSPYLRDRSAPSALVGFGIGMAGVENRRLGLALVVLGAGWWLAAIRAAHSAESSLPDSALRVANLVRRAAPGGWRQPPLRAASSYGLRATVARHLEEHSRPRRFPWLRLVRKRRYSRTLHRQVVAVVEELAAAGFVDSNLRKVATRPPGREELSDLAISLRWMGDKAAGRPADLGS